MDLKINPIDHDLMYDALERHRELAKPFGALGMLEQLSAQVAGICGSLYPRVEGGKAVVVFAADNGVVDEGVTPIGQQITSLQACNMAEGRAGISILCQHVDAKLFVVDVGMAYDSLAMRILNRRIRKGTDNIALGPAMSREECYQAMEVGREMADTCAAQGMVLLGGGEMGVGNTTTSSAILTALLGVSAKEIAGYGAGVSEDGYRKKVLAIERAVETNRCNPDDPIDVLHKLGGFDIAALVGYYIRAAQLRCVVVIDGFIAIAAAMLACRIAPALKEYLVLSHRSVEPGYDLAAKEMGLSPLLDMHMRLGEGTGCPLVFQLIEAAVRVLRDMATFEEISIDSAQLIDSWQKFRRQ